MASILLCFIMLFAFVAPSVRAGQRRIKPTGHRIILKHGPSLPPDPWVGGGTGTTCDPATDPHDCPIK